MQRRSPLPREGSTAAGEETRILTFTLGTDVYGCPVSWVSEIISLPEITRIPRLPDEVRGVINLRGIIIPVIDLRRQFGVGSDALHPRSCLIIVRRNHALTGLLVDRVQEVQTVRWCRLDLSPHDEAPDHHWSIQGFSMAGETSIRVVDIDKVLARSGLLDSPAMSIAQDENHAKGGVDPGQEKPTDPLPSSGGAGG